METIVQTQCSACGKRFKVSMQDNMAMPRCPACRGGLVSGRTEKAAVSTQTKAQTKCAGPAPRAMHIPPALRPGHQRFDGTFQTPLLGNMRSPIPIAGDGYCETSDTELTVSAHRSKSPFLPFVFLLMCGGVGGYLGKMLQLGDIGSSLGAAVAAVIALQALRLTAKKSRQAQPFTRAPNMAEPVKWQFPWTTVKSCTVNSRRPNEVIVVIKGADPSGDFRFFSSQDPQQLVSEISRRIS